MGARISAGVLKGLPLIVSSRIRPTKAKVRQALFSIVGSAIGEARVVDAFAGSGALGLEALSRGAGFVAFIESDTESVLNIRDNLTRVASDISRKAWRVLHMEVERGLPALASSEAPFDVIILDPPYRTNDAKKALNTVVGCAMLAPAGLVIIEHDQRTELPVSVGPLQQCKRHRYGDTVLSFYQAP